MTTTSCCVDTDSLQSVVELTATQGTSAPAPAPPSPDASEANDIDDNGLTTTGSVVIEENKQFSTSTATTTTRRTSTTQSCSSSSSAGSNEDGENESLSAENERLRRQLRNLQLEIARLRKRPDFSSPPPPPPKPPSFSTSPPTPPSPPAVPSSLSEAARQGGKRFSRFMGSILSSSRSLAPGSAAAESTTAYKSLSTCMSDEDSSPVALSPPSQQQQQQQQKHQQQKSLRSQKDTSVLDTPPVLASLHHRHHHPNSVPTYTNNVIVLDDHSVDLEASHQDDDHRHHHHHNKHDILNKLDFPPPPLNVGLGKAKRSDEGRTSPTPSLNDDDDDVGSLPADDDDLTIHSHHTMTQSLESLPSRRHGTHHHQQHQQQQQHHSDHTVDTLPFRQVVKDRASWLVGLLVLQSCSSFILERNETLLQKHLVIVHFLTMLVGAGGNAGNQASVRVIRGLAIGTLNNRTVRRFLVMEVKMAVCLSTILGLAGFARSAVFQTPPAETVAITASLYMIVIISICLGALLPLAMKHCRIDPAHASTTIQVLMDILGVMITVHVSAAVLNTGLGAAITNLFSGTEAG